MITATPFLAAAAGRFGNAMKPRIHCVLTP